MSAAEDDFQQEDEPQEPINNEKRAELKDEDSANEGEEVDEEEHSLKDFDLNKALAYLGNDNPQLSAKLEKDEQQLSKIRISVVKDSRRNFVLERELNDIDEKIKLLIKNRISLQEVMASASGLQDEKLASHTSPLQGKKGLYEDLFYLLQSKPKYFAKLTRLVQTKEIPGFVQTVVFDMYGDQYDTREERLLLYLFRKALRAELHYTNSKGSILRANTAITQMLSAYARRGQGLSILKDILEEPLKDITSKRELNLEIDPRVVYIQMITDFETKTGKQSELPRNVEANVAAENPEVKLLIAERVKELFMWSEHILKRIINGVDNIPFGMRWICKQLGELCKERFPDADRNQIGSLMGGYIYLRFFNPVIVTPDAINFISKKPTRIMRRNLILIAKVLQNLSNGLEFGDKEAYMKPLNEFIKKNLIPLQEYFDRLTAVDDLNDALQVDKYLEHTKQQHNVINISFNQIFLIHAILNRTKDTVCNDPNDPVRKVLEQLGAAPQELPKSGDRTVALQLIDRRKQRLSTAADAFAGPKVNPLYGHAKTLLLSVLRLLPGHGEAKDLLEFLETQKKRAEADNDTDLADHITNVISMLQTLANMSLLKKMPTPDETFNAFVWEIAIEAKNRQNRILLVEKRLKMVSQAVKAINEHHQYLQSRLELYKQYLENVRKGPQHAGEQSADNKDRAKTKKYKFTHQELEDKGIIMRTDPTIQKSLLKKCYYMFEMVEPGRFEISVHLQKGFDIKLQKPTELQLEELLKMQEDNIAVHHLDMIDLNVNLLVNLLNTKFMK